MSDLVTTRSRRDRRAASPRVAAGALAEVVKGVPVDDDVVEVLKHAELDCLAGSVAKDAAANHQLRRCAEVGCAAEVQVVLVPRIAGAGRRQLAVDEAQVIE